ncbi:MAG: hypothetical protein RIQ69_2409, partial [Pseudomonadota bacterium]
MSIDYKIAPSQMASEYIELRGQTRENSITVDTLRSYGITAESWAKTSNLGEFEATS